jgi:hypothetical protein
VATIFWPQFFSYFFVLCLGRSMELRMACPLKNLVPLIAKAKEVKQSLYAVATNTA